ncbi:hypothetical protein ACI2JA_16665 [Alkalihalobacillus sp. NPDC078783]
MRRRTLFYLSGIISAVALSYFFFSLLKQTGPEKRLNQYLQQLQQTDFQFQSDDLLDFIDPSQVNDEYLDQIEQQIDEFEPFEGYVIGEVPEQSEEGVYIPVTIRWDEYWEHEFEFHLRLLNNKWVIALNIETISSLMQSTSPPALYVQTNLNYVNTFENNTSTRIQFETSPLFYYMLLGLPYEVRYDATNQAFTLPINVGNEPFFTPPEGSASFPDGTNITFEPYIFDVFNELE